MAGATSLVQLILKKWGDDAAGAAKELEDKVGFPESVANRIATGELPMDAESVARRADEQGYGDELYHGSTHDIRYFNGEGNPENDWGAGTYLTDSTHDVSRNYAGEGPDLTNHLERHVEENEFQDFVGKDDVRTIGGKDFTESEWEAIGPEKQRDHLLTDARNEIKGENEGVIYPVRVKQDGLLSVHDQVELPDYYQQALDDLDYDYTAKNGKLTEAMEQEIEERMYELEDLDTMWVESPNPNHNMFAAGHEMDVDLSGVNRIEEGDTWEAVKQSITEGASPNDVYHSPGSVTGDTMRRSGAKGVVDPTTPDRFSSMEAGNHTIMFPGSENQIRSVNAAYDPQYTGSNIMGGAALPVAAGLLAAGQSDDADAAVSLRLLKEAPEAYNSLRKQIARGRQKGLSPQRVAEKFIHDQSMTNYDKGFNQYARKVDGTSSGEYWKEGVQGLYDEIMGAVDEPDPMVAEAMGGWLDSHLGREAGVSMAENRARARAARAAGGGVAATAASGKSGAAELLAAPMVKDSGMISAPRSENLFNITMGARDLERRLDGSLASLLFPSGLVDYLETVNRREEDPNAMTRGMALLDVLPF